MEVNDLLTELDARPHLLAFVQHLGQDCLRDRRRVAKDRHQTQESDATTDLLRFAIADSQQMWDIDGTVKHPYGDGLRDRLLPLRSTPGLATVTLLEGICRGALSVYFAAQVGAVSIERGMALPLPDRRIAGATSPNPATALPEFLLGPTSGFVIWDHDWSLELDFADRERLDQTCWLGDGKTGPRLPRIATIHPFTGHEMAPEAEREGERFFGVYPKLMDEDAADETEAEHRLNEARIIEPLIKAGSAGVDIAVVPEFTLRSPDALGGRLLETAGSTPALIVAGTSHHDGEGGRANTSVVYLDGVEILRVSKFHAFRYKPAPSDTAPDGAPVTAVRSYREDIAPRPFSVRLLASDGTRLAVAICSDLNSRELVDVLARAGVNVLLTPAWTPKVGFFEGAMTYLAIYTQCVSVVANTPHHPDDVDAPFWALSRTPHSGARLAAHSRDAGVPAVAILDTAHASEESEPHRTWLD